jgi:membrane protease YdiL (CAAX protease family)
LNKNVSIAAPGSCIRQPEKFTIANITLMGVLLIGLQAKPWAWLLLPLGLAVLKFVESDFRKDFILIYMSMTLLGITPITTDTSTGHFIGMGITLILAILVPMHLSRRFGRPLAFRFNHHRKWLKREIGYIVFTAVVSYFLLPFYLRDTGAYLNWSVAPNWDSVIRLFIGTNALGIWDELFFVSTALGIYRRYLPFTTANLVQAVLFTSFLFELGFTGWGPVMIFIFAIIQGVVFRKTDSLFYVITIHLTLDFILFLALVHLHTGWFDFLIL